jgi:cytoskeleton protein RodZ
MPKRDPEPEPQADEVVEAELPTAGQRLRAAREERKLTLEDVAAQTRIPQRHLASIETAEWDNLPAPTYTIGFAKSYAGAVGLDRTDIGNQLREEMGGQRFAASAADVFEPADPRRTMPKGLVIGAIAAVILLIIGMSWLNNRSLDQTEPNVPAENNPAAPAPGPSGGPVLQPTAPAAAQGPVVLTAVAPVWLQVSEKGGASLFSGTLQPGQTYAVPATATAPVLKTGKPEALRINVGNRVVGPVGPPATTVANVSLLAADLLKVPAAPAAAPAAAPPPAAAAPSSPAPAPRPRVRRRSPPPAAPVAPTVQTPPETNTAL